MTALMDTAQRGELVPYAPEQLSPSTATASTSGASSSDAANVVDPLEYLHLAGMVGAIRSAPYDLEWVDRESNPGPQFWTGEIDVLRAIKQLDIRVPIPVGHLLTISEATNDKLLQHCQKNQKHFTFQRVQRMLKKKEGSEEVAPPEPEAGEPEAARIAAISLAEKNHFVRARPVLWKSAECDCEVWGKPFNALIDTGSSVVAISLDTVRKTGRLGSILPQSGKDNYVLDDEEAMNIVGIIENVVVKVGRVHVLVNALVADREAVADHVQDTFRARSRLYRYLVVGQKVDSKGVMMLSCTFCNKVFQGTHFQATRHFSLTNYCKDVSDEAFYEIARRTEQKFEANQMERVSRYAAECGLDVPSTGGVRGGEAGRRPTKGGVGGDGGHGAADPTLGGGGGETEEGVIHAVETHRAELAEELEEVRQPFWVTSATLLSNGRKSRDGRPIVNFLAAGSRGVVVYTTINREGEEDDAVHVHRRWVTIFHKFSFGGPQRINAISERNWAVHEGIHTKKRNQLAFEKVVQLVEITANVRLTEYRRAGCSYVLSWQRDEGMLDCQAGLELEPVRSGTHRGMAEEEIAHSVALITQDPIRASAPPSADAVFDRRDCIFRPYPREDDSDEEPIPEAADDPALRIPRDIDETHEDPDSKEMMAHCTTGGGPGGEGDAGGRRGLLGPIRAGGGAAVEGQVAAAGGASGGAAAVEVEVGAAVEEEEAPSATAVEKEIAAQAEVQRGGDDERLMQQFLTEELGPAIAGWGGGGGGRCGGSGSRAGTRGYAGGEEAADVAVEGRPQAVDEAVQAEQWRVEGAIDARREVQETATGTVIPFSCLHLAQARQPQAVQMAVHGVPPPVITELGSEPVVVPPRLPSHFAPQEVRHPLDAEELAREVVRNVTRLDRRIFDRRLEHPPWKSICSVPWGPALPVWSGSTSTEGHTAGHVPGVSGGMTKTAPRTGDMPPPPPRAPAGDPSPSPIGRGSRSPHTPGRSRIRDTTVVQQDVCDTTIFGRTDIDLDSTRRVTEHTARLQPGLGGGGARTTATREVPASGCEPQRGRGRGVSTETLEYALRVATRGMQEQTPRKRGVPPRPRPMPAEGRATLGESSGAEGLGCLVDPAVSRPLQRLVNVGMMMLIVPKNSTNSPLWLQIDDADDDNDDVDDVDDVNDDDNDDDVDADDDDAADDDDGDDDAQRPVMTKGWRWCK
ncbi:hypothetical protein CBR_g31607 [Chara braunii]|uniref:Uncharacterized protein n=1 Tax=Chara braunii TaxID=69332 RepID=A0A388LFH8_CHABU|nr:hypothetical protein CBR_g31607 [Chara braunii]|eukprot:GBG81051.1 hypothetical protein CBR_g31607 [Chara braunii]